MTEKKDVVNVLHTAFDIQKSEVLQEQYNDRNVNDCFDLRKFNYVKDFARLQNELPFYLGTEHNIYTGLDASNPGVYFVGIVNLEKRMIESVKVTNNLQAFFKGFSNPELDFSKLDDVKNSATNFGLLYSADQYAFIVLYRYSLFSNNIVEINTIVGDSVFDFLSDANKLRLMQRRKAEEDIKNQLEKEVQSSKQ